MISVLYIGNRLSKHGSTPGVIETLGKQLEFEGVKVFYGGNKLHKTSRFLEMLWKTFQYRNKVNFVLIDTYSTSAFWFSFGVGMLCRFLKKKYIPILHGGSLPARLKKSKFYCDLLFKNSFENVAVSEYLHHAFREYGYASIIIPNNIDLHSYSFKKRLNLTPNLLWVRSFHRDYNPNMAVDVMHELVKLFPNIKLCMVGPDKDGSMELLKMYARQKNVIDRIEITGRLSKPDWHKLSEKYDIFLNTTNYDNTPVSVLEAMALGLPVVSTKVGGIPFLLDDNNDALLVEKNNFREMVEKIKFLLENPDDVNRITENARKKSVSFDWAEIKHKWIELFKK